MVSIRDIYFIVDSNIVSQGFWDVSLAAKKKLIDNELKNYIITKIQALRNTSGLIGEGTQDYSVAELLAILAELIPKENHFDTLRHFTHYILKVAGNLQNSEIVWYSESDEELIQLPFIEFDENDLWKKLKTHEQTDCVQTFNFVYDIFNNTFMTKIACQKTDGK